MQFANINDFLAICVNLPIYKEKSDTQRVLLKIPFKPQKTV